MKKNIFILNDWWGYQIVNFPEKEETTDTGMKECEVSNPPGFSGLSNSVP